MSWQVSTGLPTDSCGGDRVDSRCARKWRNMRARSRRVLWFCGSVTGVHVRSYVTVDQIAAAIALKAHFDLCVLRGARTPTARLGGRATGRLLAWGLKRTSLTPRTSSPWARHACRVTASARWARCVLRVRVPGLVRLIPLQTVTTTPRCAKLQRFATGSTPYVGAARPVRGVPWGHRSAPNMARRRHRGRQGVRSPVGHSCRTRGRWRPRSRVCLCAYMSLRVGSCGGGRTWVPWSLNTLGFAYICSNQRTLMTINIIAGIINGMIVSYLDHVLYEVGSTAHLECLCAQIPLSLIYNKYGNAVQEMTRCCVVRLRLYAVQALG